MLCVKSQRQREESDHRDLPAEHRQDKRHAAEGRTQISDRCKASSGRKRRATMANPAI